jgi:ribosomal protein L24
MNKIRKGDTVVVISGKDKGRQGTVLSVDGEQVTVENINKAKKHQKPNPQRQVAGGIVDKAMPLHISKVAIWNVRSRGHQDAQRRQARACIQVQRRSDRRLIGADIIVKGTG